MPTASKSGYFVTTPIFYISGSPHIGHAYTSIAGDILARAARVFGDAYFLTGTDEHGQKVANAARSAGLEPQAWIDSLIDNWKKLDAAYEISYDDFIRTTEPRHKRACLEVFERLRASGDVYLGKYEGWYCTNDETFWLESKLIDGRCPNPECRRAVEWLSEDDWFFALSRYRDRLLAFFREHAGWVRPQSVYNEMMAILEGGLDDLCISRTHFDWGIALPGGGVMYVWLDALLNYITALGYAADETKLRAYWPADVQLIGKEIARFHTIIWPAVLWALNLPAPSLVFAHGWITFDGEKMSKSKGNVVDPFEIVERFGADSIRYFLMREAHFGSDFSFSEEKVRQRHNNDLGNDLGNLVKRTLSMLERYRNSLVPQPPSSSFGERFTGLGSTVYAHIRELRFRDALDAIWELVTALNREIELRKPWELHKAGKTAELDALLYDLCEGIRWLALLLHPFIPEKATQIWRQLGMGGEPVENWNVSLAWGGLAVDTQTAPGAVLFPRLEAPVEV